MSLKKVIDKYYSFRLKREEENNIKSYLSGGRIPWSRGYGEYRESEIRKVLSDQTVLHALAKGEFPDNFGKGLDERIVEYGWILGNLPDSGNILDAGSTFNYRFIIDHPLIRNRDLTIFTYYPESNCFWKNRISYMFGDLRDLPFRQDLFDVVVCQSTIEHVGMDNSIYGYGSGKSGSPDKNKDYLQVIQELIRILKPGGNLLLTFPFGKYEDHGFFQQFDSSMLDEMMNSLSIHGSCKVMFAKYFRQGWKAASKEDCTGSESFNPHTGKGKGDDGAAHSRTIAMIRFIKSTKALN